MNCQKLIIIMNKKHNNKKLAINNNKMEINFKIIMKIIIIQRVMAIKMGKPIIQKKNNSMMYKIL